MRYAVTATAQGRSRRVAPACTSRGSLDSSRSTAAATGPSSGQADAPVQAEVRQDPQPQVRLADADFLRPEADQNFVGGLRRRVHVQAVVRGRRQVRPGRDARGGPCGPHSVVVADATEGCRVDAHVAPVRARDQDPLPDVTPDARVGQRLDRPGSLVTGKPCVRPPPSRRRRAVAAVVAAAAGEAGESQERSRATPR